MEKTSLPEEVERRLEMIDWESVEKTCGITKEKVLQNETVARQLAYGQQSDLIFGYTDTISGLFSLKSFPTNDGEVWKVKVSTIEQEKTMDSDLYFMGTKIYSEPVKKALLEKTDWIGADGRRRYGYANASAGRYIPIERDGKKVDYLLSIHQPTNKIIGMPRDQVLSFFFDGEVPRQRQVYGKELDEEQIRSLCEGNSVIVRGCRDKDCNEFNVCVQFDAAQRRIVVSHPTWIKQAMKDGFDIGLGTVSAKKSVDGAAEKSDMRQTRRRSRSKSASL